jgi:NAD(P)-dependent dehydrogenase (short-subunit alcohol dehydrogenase family)
MPGPSPNQRSIFITGAASGIGLAAARLFAARNYVVGLADVNEPALHAAAAGLPAGQVVACVLDVRDPDQWRTGLAAFAERTGGRLDILVNNAGIAPFGWFDAIPPDQNGRMIDVNVKGVINGAYEALPYLKATPGSRLINIASCASLYGTPRLAVYSATKFAVRGLSEALDIEFGRYGIAVSCVMPWFIDTPLLDDPGGASNEHLRDLVTSGKQPMYTAEEAAETIWQAAHGTKLYYIAGAAGRRFGRMARHLPGLVRRSLSRSVAAG